jgi:predicted nucleotidyltransferase component of viral defense system
MKTEKRPNIAASHRVKLLTLAHERREDFQFVLGRWAVERFLFRLSRSEHRDRFVLKGATLFLAWAGKLHRPTKDLDLLGRGIHEVGEVVNAIRDICSVECDDGLKFNFAEIEGWRIAEDAEYDGVRVKVPASLDGARIPMQIDIGFGDAVEPAPQSLTFPVLLPLDAPIVSAYPPEAVVAEKFHAMMVLGIANSRMKDFFDVWTLASTYNFEMDALSRAVRSTFDRRRAELPRGTPLALTSEFLEDPSKKLQWARS